MHPPGDGEGKCDLSLCADCVNRLFRLVIASYHDPRLQWAERTGQEREVMPLDLFATKPIRQWRVTGDE